MSARAFEIDRWDLGRVRFVDDETTGEPGAGQALLAIERFGLSANNVTYALFGEAMKYWDFFPASAPGWGRLPVWGFAEVAASKVAGVSVGARFYGYFPLAGRLIVTPQKVAAEGFVDASPHRAGLPGAYNRYVNVAHDPVYDPGREDAQMLLHPLFITSWLLDDFLADAADFGAERVILTSASSKTAIGLADQIAARVGVRPRLVGLTSAGKEDDLRALALYDEVESYSRIKDLDSRAASVIVDFAGAQTVIHDLYARLADLRRTVLVGAAKGDLAGPGYADLTPRPEFFFAPDQVRKRNQDWGPHGLMRRYAPDWRRFRGACASRFAVREVAGEAEVAAAFADLVDGRVAMRDAFAARL